MYPVLQASSYKITINKSGFLFCSEDKPSQWHRSNELQDFPVNNILVARWMNDSHDLAHSGDGLFYLCSSIEFKTIF